MLAAGYTLGGKHFTMPLSAETLNVPVQPNPVPLGTMRIRVFHDNAPVDATYEAGPRRAPRAVSRAWPASRRTCPTSSAR